MEKKIVREAMNDSYKKWTFLRDIGFKSNNYDVQKAIQSTEIKEYEKYHFLKKLSEVMNGKKQY